MQILRKLALCIIVAGTLAPAIQAELKAGAAIVDISPQQFPVLVNGEIGRASCRERV